MKGGDVWLILISIWKEKKKKEVEITLFTPFFTCSSEAELKLQQKIISYVDKRQVAHHHTQVWLFSDTHTHTLTLLSSFLSSKLKCPKHSCWAHFHLYILNSITERNYLDVINKGTYRLERTIQTTQKHSGIGVLNLLSHPVSLPFCRAPPCDH